MQRLGVRIRIDRDRADPEPPRRADHAACNLAAIGDEQGLHSRAERISCSWPTHPARAVHFLDFAAPDMSTGRRRQIGEHRRQLRRLPTSSLALTFWLEKARRYAFSRLSQQAYAATERLTSTSRRAVPALQLTVAERIDTGGSAPRLRRPRQRASQHRHILNTPNCGRSGIGAFSVAAKASPSTSRVCAGSMMPSSHSRAVACQGLPCAS